MRLEDDEGVSLEKSKTGRGHSQRKGPEVGTY